MNNPERVFQLCARCLEMYSPCPSLFVYQGKQVCRLHGEYDFYPQVTVACRGCAEVGGVCQKCGKPIEKPVEKKQE